MSMLWIICGAGRSVGKTTLALKLCEVLPESIYAKCGRSRAKPGKSDNFFDNLADLESFIEAKSHSKRHMVIESNTLAMSCRGDITIFIDGVPEKTNFREDTEQLRSVADIKICCDTTLTDWKKALAAKVDCRSLRKAVCDCLLTQSRHLFGSEPVVRSKVWFESAGTHVFGCGLARLLENVNRLGTLHSAAKAADMSYRYAWNLIRMAEEHFGKTLIERHVGGVDGGSSALSADGRHMLRVFKQLNKEVAVFADGQFLELYNKDKASAKI
ncbi:MAG: LysR family transcriptional regulator [Planctomycetes bacterium]|nr:LysR family transcriptional regulator [Planctomycetota bacterium]